MGTELSVSRRHGTKSKRFWVDRRFIAVTWLGVGRRGFQRPFGRRTWFQVLRKVGLLRSDEIRQPSLRPAASPPHSQSLRA